MVSVAPFNFGLQTVLSRRKIQAVYEQRPRSSATKEIRDFLVSCLGNDGFWSAIDQGLTLGGIAKGLLRNTSSLPTLASLGWDYLKLLCSEDLYRDELRLKLGAKL